MKKVYLIRHGETIHNRENNQLSGVTDIQLTEKGKDQCLQLSKYFIYKKIDEVYVSPLSRATNSAKYIFPNYVEVFSTVQILTEINYGRYEGFDRIKQTKKDAIIEQWDSAPADLTFPDGDNVRDHAKRVYDGLIRLLTYSNGSIIACVSHRTTIRLLIAQILKMDLNFFRIIPCSNCSVTQLEFSSALGLKLITLNAGLEYTSTLC